MKDIKVLGCGCSNKGAVVARVIEEIAKEKGVDVRIEQVTDMQRIAAYGVMSTPGVVIDGRVVHAGGVPPRAKVAEWL
ncbi:MAG TPA: thioredoxin family protein [Usitatibacter sp.]|nr:thioredoxin family protein [Usitatibacter sp.]